MILFLAWCQKLWGFIFDHILFHIKFLYNYFWSTWIKGFNFLITLIIFIFTFNFIFRIGLIYILFKIISIIFVIFLCSITYSFTSWIYISFFLVFDFSFQKCFFGITSHFHLLILNLFFFLFFCKFLFNQLFKCFLAIILGRDRYIINGIF